MPDHFGDQLAPVPALAAVAAATSTLRMGALVFCNDYRHPFVLAKEAATLDVLSEGRFELSLGAGWMRSDYDEAGLSYDHPAVRVARFEEAVKVVQGLLRTDGPFSFHGEHYEVLGHTLTPRPVQTPGPPLIIGGGGKRVLSFAARHADIVSINVNLREGTGGAETAADATPERTRTKLAWVKEAAGVRFDDLELNSLIGFVHRHRRRTGTGRPDGASLRHRPRGRIARPARADRHARRDDRGARVAAGRIRHLLLVDRVGLLGDARPRGEQARRHVTITTSTGWEAIGVQRELCGERVFTIDVPSIGPERHVPLLVLHGFPTSSFDYAAVLDGLRAGRRVVLLDMVGYGLSAKPDRAYSMALQADVAAAYVAALGIERLALLTHDMGDTVGGELLARRAEGAWPVEVTRRVVTNGSIYIEQAHLTNGQQLLLGLPDELLPPGIPIDAASITQSLRDTFSRGHAARARGLARGPGAGGGGAGRPRRRPPRAAAPHPLHRGTAGERAPLHRGHRDRPLAAAHRVGPRRPRRRAVNGRHSAGCPPRRHRAPPRGRRPLPDGRGAAALPRRRAGGTGLTSARRAARTPGGQAGAITLSERTSAGRLA